MPNRVTAPRLNLAESQIEQHYTTCELAELLACHTETILRAAQRGELRSVRVGSERRYPESAVRDYLQRRGHDGGRVVQLRRRRKTAR